MKYAKRFYRWLFKTGVDHDFVLKFPFMFAVVLVGGLILVGTWWFVFPILFIACWIDALRRKIACQKSTP